MARATEGIFSQPPYSCYHLVGGQQVAGTELPQVSLPPPSQDTQPKPQSPAHQGLTHSDVMLHSWPANICCCFLERMLSASWTILASLFFPPHRSRRSEKEKCATAVTILPKRGCQIASVVRELALRQWLMHFCLIANVKAKSVVRKLVLRSGYCNVATWQTSGCVFC